MKIKDFSIVYFKDDQSKHPFLVHEVLDDNNVILGLRKYPDIEQDFAVSKDKLSLFENGEESRKAEKLMQQLLN
jgi:hypothetical protein